MKVLIIGILCLLSLPAIDQNKTADNVSEDDKATVYIYKTWHVATLWRAAFAVYIDERMVARLDRGIFLMAKLSPGKHSFHSKDKKSGGVELNLEAGKVYYLRLQTDSGAQVTHARITIPTKEESDFDIKQMNPIEKKDIKDPSIVFVPEKQH